MEEERNRFEAWWVGNFAFGFAVDDAKFLQRRGYEYSHSDTNMMWKAWTAACAWQREQDKEAISAITIK